ncbi:MAG: hypothetical protein OEV44_12570 [Spirochaetota bacterium]|nr:hypothetical protein [Spirochaetota bacterium]
MHRRWILAYASITNRKRFFSDSQNDKGLQPLVQKMTIVCEAGNGTAKLYGLTNK